MYFSHPSRQFAETDEALRIRRKAGQALITYKGPKVDRTTKTRREIELPLGANEESAAAWVGLLQVLHFTPVAEVFKSRRKAFIPWMGQTVEVSLDDVRDVGTYAELELVVDEQDVEPAKTLIASLAAELELRENERRSYLELLLEGEKRVQGSGFRVQVLRVAATSIQTSFVGHSSFIHSSSDIHRSLSDIRHSTFFIPMSTFRLLLAEIGYRKLNFALSLAAVAVAATLFVAGPILVDGYARETAAELSGLQQRVDESAERLTAAETRVGRRVGPARRRDPQADARPGLQPDAAGPRRRQHRPVPSAMDCRRVDMPQEFIHRLAADTRLTFVTHLVATLRGTTNVRRPHRAHRRLPARGATRST